MTREESVERAKELFAEGYNCAQAVFGAFAQALGMDLDTAMRLSCPFGGGFGRTREVCGAVSGMCMVLGLSGQPFDPQSPTQKGDVYAKTQTLLSRFKEENGSVICRELLAGVKHDTSSTPEQRSAEYYKKRPCEELVGISARIIGEKLHQMTNNL